MTSIDKALKLLRKYPRVSADNIADLPRSRPSKFHGHARKKGGFGHRGQSQYQAWNPIGHLEVKTPFYITVPKEPYNADPWRKRPMKKLSLLELQRMIDLNRLNSRELIDLTAICNTGLFNFNVERDREYGLDLTDDGVDNFVSPVVIEVQHASEQVIAAIERAGGVIVTRFYDLFSVYAKARPIQFFKRGIPIPKAKLPPQEIADYYISAENRGYLANPEEVNRARVWLAQKYAYKPTDLGNSPEWMQSAIAEVYARDPRQIFTGLGPGCLVSMSDKCVFWPKDPLLTEFYKS